jgi:hypothetical protein
MTTTTAKRAPVRNSTGPVLALRLAHAFSVIAETLPNPWDESTDYFVPFWTQIADTEPLNADTLRAVLEVGGVGDRYRLDIDAADFAAVADGFDDTSAQAFRVLDAAFRATLTDLTRVFARADGVVRVRTWVFGRLTGGWLVGLRTETTET